MEKEELNPQLALIPIKDLLSEVESRTDEFICSYIEKGTIEKDNVEFYYGNGTWVKSSGLASMLKNEIANNWSGALETLYRINDEGEL